VISVVSVCIAAKHYCECVGQVHCVAETSDNLCVNVNDQLMKMTEN